MKHFMLPLVRDPNPNPFPFSELSNSTNPKPNFHKHKLNRKHKLPPRDKENSDLGTNPDSVTGKPSPACKFRVPFSPKPPNPLKRKFSNDVVSDFISVGHCSSSSLDSGVKVLVRIRPLNKDEEDGELTVQKISNDSLSINGQTFTFDSVADTEATQLDVFECVGAPLVENCLAGFNSSVFAYGQTGSGKTYTMWGPSNALLEGNLNDRQGLTPRVFERLFSRMSEEQNKHADKQLRYQCRCSFLEIYNEQITDLLDPKQKNLQIREDVKSGIYVENLTEEHVSSLGDVMQLLLKGLSNRRTGTTSINAESSRSHSVFTCVVESHCKSASNGLSSFKTSRINLVDLAGSERQKLTGAAGKRLKEAGNINRSLSQLGNLINILAEISQTGKQRHIPYRDSKLTFLLQESLGGNAKLAMICAISPARRCKNETFSTLRFAQRAKAIKNKAVVNEVMQDDVNFLREVIQQLKDELLRMKAHGNQADPSAAYANSWNARRSINLLKFNLNQPNLMRHVDEDGDEVMEIDEEAVDRLCTEVGQQSTDSEVSHYADRTVKDCEHSGKQLLDSERNSQPKTSEIAHIEKQNVEVSEVSMEEEMSEIEKMKDQQTPTSKSNGIARMEEVLNEVPCKQIEDGSVPLSSDSVTNMNTETANDFPTDPSESVAPNLSIVPCDVSPALPSPTPSVSPRLVISSSRKSLRTSTTLTASQKNVQSCELGKQDAKASSAKFPQRSSQLDLTAFSSNGALSTTDQLAASRTLPSPTKSVSPTLVISSSRKSLRTSTMQTASQKNVQSCELCNQDAKASSAKSPQRSSQLDLSAISRHTGLSTTDQLAASLHHGLEICNSHQQSSTLRKSAFRFSFKPADWKPLLPIKKVNVGIQTFPEATETPEDGMIYLCSNCKNQTLHEDSKEANDTSNLPLVPMEKSLSAEKPKKQVPKAVEKVLAGAIRREMALEDFCAKQTSEISQLNRLVQQYKHERECNAIIGQLREDKIIRLESLMDGVLPSEDFMELELVSLHKEHELLKEKYENHPEVLRTKIELKRVQDELERLQNFFDMGERDVLVEEIHDLRNQLQYYIDNSQTNRQQKSLVKLTFTYEPSSASPLNAISELTEEDAMQKLERERSRWMEMESQLITRTEELKTELEASRRQSEQLKRELEKEKKCSGELKEALQLAMEGHARMLEQYADLEEKHMEMLTGQRMIQEEIGDVKKAAARAGVKGAESKFINALAAEISALKVEREKERQYMRDENRMLQAQLRDTAEAVQAAGELLVRLKEAEEAVSTAEKRAAEAEEEREKSRKQMEKLKKKHETEISKLKQLIAESNTVRHDTEEHHITCDERWKEEIEAFCGNGVDDKLSSKFTDPSSWFSGYDRCNI